ncbi:DUF397 domain-containing protein [Streptomyces sp. NPDC127119]|uniref:DUF397 domain-containing protein n=1 Tax=Streptomyces sp. NPDC127119 TaxID=3345370 RepID=UPI00363A3B0A
MRKPEMAQAGDWQKSSFSGDQEGPNCLEIGAGQSAFLLRESENPGTVLEATGAELVGLIRHLRRTALSR